MKYYIAYGSNLNVTQMGARCPHAKIAGTAVVKDYELLFKGSKTGSYLTIEECPGAEVPVVVWSVEDSDEKNLDRYEGYPDFYYKKEFKLKYKEISTGKRKVVTAFAYIMHEDRSIGIPSNWYMQTCLDGYSTFFFDQSILVSAYDKCKKVVQNGK